MLHRVCPSIMRDGSSTAAVEKSVEKIRVNALKFCCIWVYSKMHTCAALHICAVCEEQNLLFPTTHFVPLGDHLIRSAEHRTRTRTIGLTDQTLAFHHVENRGGAAVADAQPSL
jgi:hypothetical protein